METEKLLTVFRTTRNTTVHRTGTWYIRLLVIYCYCFWMWMYQS